jgi:antitoxin component HigA of HigAB toxin-antitoxin module
MASVGRLTVAQERNESDTARAVALQSLKHELALALRLLREVKEAREVIAIETHVINSARDAFRHAVEALDRMPQLTPEDMQAVQALMDHFRTALADLNQ